VIASCGTFSRSVPCNQSHSACPVIELAASRLRRASSLSSAKTVSSAIGQTLKSREGFLPDMGKGALKNCPYSLERIFLQVA